MDKVLIIVNAKVKAEGKLIASPVTEKMVRSLAQAIEQETPSPAIEIVTPPALRARIDLILAVKQRPIYCPLTIQIPYSLRLPAQEIFQACQDIQGRREWVAQKLGFKTNLGDASFGDRWLPVIVLPDGLRFGEVIGEGEVPNAYQQPIEVNKQHRKPLMSLARKLIEALKAPPAVYLLQFTVVEGDIVFDRLWPFPAAPAIASLSHPEPNLYHLYWQCIRKQQLIEA
jgi:hypothetical protein